MFGRYADRWGGAGWAVRPAIDAEFGRMYLRDASADDFVGPYAAGERAPHAREVGAREAAARVAPSPRKRATVGAGFGVARRCLDVILALAAIIAVLPLLVAISLTIKLQDKGPALFSQERLGRGGRRFRCHKFRSMHTDAETRLAALLDADPQLREEWAQHHKLKDDPRITPIGAFLRRSSLDELPQLFNILKGEMSLVGPRPIVEAEIAKYGRWYAYHQAVTPGLTGLWQVCGRSDVSYRRRVALDRLYVRIDGLWTYLWIIAATVPAVLRRNGSY
jgi:lipopolysaccharide/colanic/teichoic acid biosynthesis glycosyltransferase